MEFYLSLVACWLTLFRVTDEFPLEFNDTLETTTTSDEIRNTSLVSNHIKVKLTAIYFYLMVLFTLFIISFIFYWTLYYKYKPKLRPFPSTHTHRSGLLLYQHINRRYHKNANRTVSKLNSSNCSLHLNKSSSNNINNHTSHFRPEEEKKKNGCFCCAKTKKTETEEYGQIGRGKPRSTSNTINLYNQHPGLEPPKSYDSNQTRSQTIQQYPLNQRNKLFEPQNQQRPNSQYPIHPSNQIPPPQQPPTLTLLSPQNLPIQQQQEPMYYNNPQTPVQPIYFYPPQSAANSQYTQSPIERNRTPMTYQGEGPSTSVTVGSYSKSKDEPETVVQNKGCCVRKKKPNGQIVPQVYAYKVDGHIRVKGKKNKNIISIPTDTYIVN